MKKSSLSIILSIVAIGLIIGGILFYRNFQMLPPPPPETHTITIMSGKPINDSLEIIPSNLETIRVRRKDSVIWRIDSASNVDVFKLSLKVPAPELFRGTYPGLQYTTYAPGKIGNNAKLNTIYEYNIHWKMKGDPTEYVLDPKLAIVP